LEEFAGFFGCGSFEFLLVLDVLLGMFVVVFGKVKAPEKAAYFFSGPLF